MMYGLIILMLAVAAKATCPEKYAAIDSSLCLSDDEKLIATMVPSSEEQTEIVTHHNDLRRAVVAQPNDVTPSHMPELVWDDNLAAVAQKWSQSQCNLAHDDNDKRAIPEYPGTNIGQNGAYASWERNWTQIIDGWQSEVKFFYYGESRYEAGHFTQNVCDRTTRVGCGQARCSNGYFAYCNYGPGQFSWATPFTTGTRGEGCGSNLKDGLCSGDCAGKLCYNYGTLDTETCTCKCRSSYSSADDCKTATVTTTTTTTAASVDCSNADPSLCGMEQPWGYPDSSYCRFSNVPGVCPHMCSKCT